MRDVCVCVFDQVTCIKKNNNKNMENLVQQTKKRKLDDDQSDLEQRCTHILKHAEMLNTGYKSDLTIIPALTTTILVLLQRGKHINEEIVMKIEDALDVYVKRIYRNYYYDFDLHVSKLPNLE